MFNMKKYKREKARQYYETESGKESARRASIKWRYGLSHEDWLKMWEDQDGKCAICREPFAQPSDAHIDHNHKTGKVRGLLCRKCNSGIGHFDDDPKLMLNVIEYLDIYN